MDLGFGLARFAGPVGVDLDAGAAAAATAADDALARHGGFVGELDLPPTDEADRDAAAVAAAADVLACALGSGLPCLRLA